MLPRQPSRSKQFAGTRGVFMPLARIVTTFTEESLPLQEQLRARGFEVVTASPGQLFPQVADLEISLEELTPAQALARADEIARPDDLPVFISPGSISETSRPIVVVPVRPEVEPQLVAPPATVQEVPAEDLEFDPVAFAENADFATEYSAVEAAPQIEGNLEPADLTSGAEFEDEFVEQPDFEEQPALPVAQSMTEVAPAEEPFALAPEMQQILPELEAAMPDMEAWAQEEGPVSDWPIWQAGAIDPVELVTTPPAPRIEPIPVTSRQEVRTFRRRAAARDRVFWKTAAWAAMVTLSALLLGATVHRFSPVPAKFANSPQPSDVRPPQNAPVAAPAVVRPTVALKRTAAHESRQTPPPPLRPRQSVAPKPSVRRWRGSSSDSTVAEDTVVRYGAKPAPRVQAQVKSDGIKRYSDLK